MIAPTEPAAHVALRKSILGQTITIPSIYETFPDWKPQQHQHYQRARDEVLNPWIQRSVSLLYLHDRFVSPHEARWQIQGGYKTSALLERLKPQSLESLPQSGARMPHLISSAPRPSILLGLVFLEITSNIISDHHTLQYFVYDDSMAFWFLFFPWSTNDEIPC